MTCMCGGHTNGHLLGKQAQQNSHEVITSLQEKQPSFSLLSGKTNLHLTTRPITTTVPPVTQAELRNKIVDVKIP